MNDDRLDALLTHANPVHLPNVDPERAAALRELRDEITATSRLSSARGRPHNPSLVSRRPWRNTTAAAAVTVVVVGAASMLALRSGQLESDDATGSAAPVATPAAAAAPDAWDWYLPEPIPVGYALSDLAIEPIVGARAEDEGCRDSDCGARIWMVLTPVAGGDAISIQIAPATDADAAVVEEFPPDDIVVVDEVEYSIFNGQADRDTEIYSVEAVLADGQMLSVINAPSQMVGVGIASSVNATTAARAREMGAAIDESLHDLPVVASATFSDGIGATVRRAEDADTGNVAVCLETPDPVCRQPYPESRDGMPAVVVVSFATPGGRRIVAWHENADVLEAVSPDAGAGLSVSFDSELVEASVGPGVFMSAAVASDEIVGVTVDSDGGWLFPAPGIVPSEPELPD